MDHVHIQPDIRSAWCGPSLLVVNTRGECGEEAPLTGYYFREARHLRTLLALIGMIGTVLSCTLVAYGFARFRFPGRTLLFTILIAVGGLSGTGKSVLARALASASADARCASSASIGRG